MAHELDFSKGSAAFAYAGAEAWHGYGNKLTPGAPLETWVTEAGLDYRIELARVKYEARTENGMESRAADGKVVLYRSDNGAALGLASDGYKAVQPFEVVEFFRDLCANHGLAMETAGALRGGARYFALARTALAADLSNTPGRRDPAVLYLLLVSSADCSLSTTALPTATRVVCANTLRMAMGGDGNTRKDGAVKRSHRSAFVASDVHRELGYTLGDLSQGFDAYVADMHKLNGVAVNSPEVARSFFTALLRPPQAAPAGVMDAAAFQAALGTPSDDDERKTPRGLKGLMESYYEAPGAMPGTARGLLEAVTHFVDHKRGTTDEGRMDSAALGQGASLKERALAAALALA